MASRSPFSTLSPEIRAKVLENNDFGDLIEYAEVSSEAKSDAIRVKPTICIQIAENEKDILLVVSSENNRAELFSWMFFHVKSDFVADISGADDWKPKTIGGLTIKSRKEKNHAWTSICSDPVDSAVKVTLAILAISKWRHFHCPSTMKQLFWEKMKDTEDADKFLNILWS